MSVTLTRICHSSVLLDFDGERILTDPWYSEKPGYYHGEPYGIALADLPHLDGVVGSHGHYDHFDMPSFAAYPHKDVPFAVKTGMAAAAHAVGFRSVTELEPWQTVQLGQVTVTAAPGAHSVPENCYVIEAGGMTVFFGGDSLYVPGLNDVAHRFPTIDLALLPINGLRIRPMLNRKIVMTAEDAAELCRVLQPRIAVPRPMTGWGALRRCSVRSVRSPPALEWPSWQPSSASAPAPHKHSGSAAAPPHLSLASQPSTTPQLWLH